jgi:hypothetical protein
MMDGIHEVMILKIVFTKKRFLNGEAFDPTYQLTATS